MYCWVVAVSCARLSSLPLRSKKPCCTASGCAWYSATVIVVRVTPGAVAPPLSRPVHGSTHGAAYPIGMFTVPVAVSHCGPQSTVAPRRCASGNVSGSVRRARAVAPADGADVVATATAHATASTTRWAGSTPSSSRVDLRAGSRPGRRPHLALDAAKRVVQSWQRAQLGRVTIHRHDRSQRVEGVVTVDRAGDQSL